VKHDPLNTGSDNVVSVGGGFHSVLNNRFRLDATVAVPLRAAGVSGLVNGRPDTRFLVSLTTKLWPWGNR